MAEKKLTNEEKIKLFQKTVFGLSEEEIKKANQSEECPKGGD